MAFRAYGNRPSVPQPAPQAPPGTREQLPALTGARLRQRKRNIVQKYEPEEFTEALCTIIEDNIGDLEKAFKEVESSTLDFRRYADYFFDTIICGGMGAATGKAADDIVPKKWSIFGLPPEEENLIDVYATFLDQMLRRMPYLKQLLAETYTKIISSLRVTVGRGFGPRLAQITAQFVVKGMLLPSTTAGTYFLAHLMNSTDLVEAGVCLEFLTLFMVEYQKIGSQKKMRSLLKQCGLSDRLIEFMPTSKRSNEEYSRHFKNAGLNFLVDERETKETRSDMEMFQSEISDLIRSRQSVQEVAEQLLEGADARKLTSEAIIGLGFDAVMASVDWSSRLQQIPEQALKQVGLWAPLLGKLCTNPRAEVQLIWKIQEYCYEEARFQRIFGEIVTLLYDNNVLQEDPILFWFKRASKSKGRTVFLKQLERFVQWLETAEEEGDDEDGDGAPEAKDEGE